MRLLREAALRAPELQPADWAAGDPHALEMLRGRVVLLDFFSTADPLGIAALGPLHALSDHYRDSGLTVIGVHVPAYGFERSLAAARQELWRLGIPYPVAMDAGFVVFRAYENRDLPARYLIDADGFVRAWEHGAEAARGLEAAERAFRTLIREKDPARALPPSMNPSELGAPPLLDWRPTPEVRLGLRGVGFGPPDLEGEPEDGQVRDFDDLPEMRAQGAAYLQGRWRLGADRIVLDGDEGGLAIVYEGADVVAVFSAEESDDDAVPTVTVTVDGEMPEEIAGGDLEDHSGEAVVPVGRGRLYHLIASREFGIHNLELRVRGRGAALHLLHFGSAAIPEQI